MEVKFEIKLKAKEPINGYKVGETVIIVNPIFDRNIGIAFFPIDKNFDIVYQRQFTGLKDKNGYEIYDKDIIKKEHTKYEVLFREGEWVCTSIIDYYREQFYKLYFFDFSKVVKIGSVYENPELIKSLS